MSAPDAPIIAYDLPCRRCRYNLRTQRADGRCPECGTPVAVTLGDEPAIAPLVDTPEIRRHLAVGCFGLAATVPLFAIANWIVHTFFHSAGIFWEVDPPYLLGPASLVLMGSMAVLCWTRERIDGSPAYRGLRGVTFAVALSVPLSIASWEVGYAFAPFDRYDAFMQISDGLAVGGPLAVGLALLLIGLMAREMRLPDLPPALFVFAAFWILTSPIPTLYVSAPNAADRFSGSWTSGLAGSPWLLNFIWIFAVAETTVLLLGAGAVLRHSARVRAGTSRSAGEPDPPAPPAADAHAHDLDASY